MENNSNKSQNYFINKLNIQSNILIFEIKFKNYINKCLMKKNILGYIEHNIYFLVKQVIKLNNNKNQLKYNQKYNSNIHQNYLISKMNILKNILNLIKNKFTLTNI